MKRAFTIVELVVVMASSKRNEAVNQTFRCTGQLELYRKGVTNTTSVDERLSTLEANDKTLFHQVDGLKEDIRDIRRLTVAIEKIAGKVDNIDLKVDNVDSKVNGIDERLQTVEHVPATNWNKLKQAIISSIVSVVVGGLLGALIALVIK